MTLFHATPKDKVMVFSNFLAYFKKSISTSTLTRVLIEPAMQCSPGIFNPYNFGDDYAEGDDVSSYLSPMSLKVRFVPSGPCPSE